mmetsp:Transcript_21644/g.45758  ORF Transcript_21644/g.45758 Transcript_21644/m.45758 type:complete len:120 (+) Transcript_21644:85-444(+)|eukprot:CAMPEP_0183738946 /NCGR_PEP_ID=MMETSP0737-20130205/55842_1 /TAXON_ID=385413 /ORGANISM="Thalassiosira miniscula, Strain CCMP1093" /LENGTH=119 /DNA_ID=CAMNT_0025973605 /DNA_START=64 /DNA_END=423 /DNA_ORIENTATION=+
MKSAIIALSLLTTGASAQMLVQPRHQPQAATGRGAGKRLRGLQEFEWAEGIEIDGSMSVSSQTNFMATDWGEASESEGEEKPLGGLLDIKESSGKTKEPKKGKKSKASKKKSKAVKSKN